METNPRPSSPAVAGGYQAASSQSPGGPAVTGSGRAIQACDRCRMKKVRCDGLLPSCSRCRNAGLECKTEIKLTRKSYPRSYTESIEERLREAEEKQRETEVETQRLRDAISSKDRRIQELEYAAMSRPSPQYSNSEPSRASLTPGSSISGRRDNRAQPKRHSMGDSVSIEVGRMNSDRNGVGRFMGASSGIYFVGLAQQRFSTLTSMPWHVGHDLLRIETDDQSMEYQIQPAALVKDFLVDLPPYEIAIQYCDAWFEFWRYIFPILHRPTFMRNLELMYFKKQTLPDSDIPAEIFAIFYLVLALGSRQLQLSGKGPSGRPDTGSSGDDVIYFEKAMSYYGEVIQISTIRTIQFNELLVLWYVSTGKRSLALQIIGSVARLCLELGMHRHSKRNNWNPLTREVRKRTFWVCYILDSYLSTIAGVPRALRDQDIDTDAPSNVEDDSVSSAGYLPSRTFEPSGMIAFVSLVKVSRILAQAQELLYTTATRSDTFAKISSLGRLLDQWQASLPEHMRLDFNEMALMTPEEAAADLGRGAPEMVFTQLIWLYARLIVYRPSLSFRQPNEALSASLTHLEYIPREIILLLSLVRNPLALANELSLTLMVKHRQFLLLFDINPGAHAYTLWQCGLMCMYVPHAMRDSKDPRYLPGLSHGYEEEARNSTRKTVELLEYMRAHGRSGEGVRAQNLRDILAIEERRAVTTAITPAETPPSQAPSPSNRFLSYSSSSNVNSVTTPNAASPYISILSPHPTLPPSNAPNSAVGTLPVLRSFTGFGAGFVTPFEFAEYVHPYDRLPPEMVVFTSGTLHHGSVGGPMKDIWDDGIFNCNNSTTLPSILAANKDSGTGLIGGSSLTIPERSLETWRPAEAFQPAARPSKRLHKNCHGVGCAARDCESCWTPDPSVPHSEAMRPERESAMQPPKRRLWEDCNGHGCGNCSQCTSVYDTPE